MTEKLDKLMQEKAEKDINRLRKCSFGTNVVVMLNDADNLVTDYAIQIEKLAGALKKVVSGLNAGVSIIPISDVLEQTLSDYEQWLKS